MKYSIALLIAISGLLLSPAAAQTPPPVIEAPEGLRFVYPLPAGTPAAPVGFLVYSSGAPIEAAVVQAKEVKDPDGRAAVDALTVKLEAPRIPQEGTRVTLDIQKPERFAKPGDYTVVLRFKGSVGTGADAKDVAPKLVQAVIQHPAAQLNVDELKGLTFSVWRPLPFLPARGTFAIDARETTSRADLHALELRGGGLVFAGTRNVATGRLELTPASADGASGQQKPAPASADVPAGGVRKVEVTVAGATQVGTFDTQVIARSPSLGSSVAIPMKVVLSDGWWCPLFAIILGVAGGAYVRWLVKQKRPHIVATHRLVRLKGEYHRLRPLVTTADKVARLQVSLESLQEVEERLAFGDPAGAETALAAAETTLKEFAAAEIKAAGALRADLEAFEREVVLYQKGLSSSSPEETARLTELQRQAGEVSDTLAGGQVDLANAGLVTLRASFTQLQTVRLQRDLDGLRTHYDTTWKGLPVGTAGADTLKQAIDAELLAAETAIAEARLPEARSSLRKLAGQMTQLASLNPAQGARPTRRVVLESAISAPPPPLSRIVVLAPPDEIRAGARTYFEVRDEAGVLQPGDRLQWDFGDGAPPKQESDLQTWHEFSKIGEFQVRVGILPGAGAVPGQQPKSWLDVKVKVHPGQRELAQIATRRKLSDLDLTLTVISGVLASITGLLVVYATQPFGTMTHYLGALLWGFGVDQSVRSVGGVLQKVGTGTGD